MNTIKLGRKNVKVIAHRGLSGIEAENTAVAFVAAGNRSYYGIEADIYKTTDARFIINHDGNLLRVAGEDVDVEKVSYTLLQNVILFDKDNSKHRLDLRICTLENFISICAKYEKHAFIELKPKFTEEEIVKLIAIINAKEYLNEVTFISFNYENLKKIRKIYPEQSVQLLTLKPTKDIISRLIKERIDIGAQFLLISKELIEQFHKANLKVNCWTVDKKETALRLADLGVDYITTNILE